MFKSIVKKHLVLVLVFVSVGASADEKSWDNYWAGGDSSYSHKWGDGAQYQIRISRFKIDWEPYLGMIMAVREPKRNSKKYFMDRIRVKLNDTEWYTASLHKRIWNLAVEFPAISELTSIITDVRFSPEGEINHATEVKEGTVVGPASLMERKLPASLVGTADKAMKRNTFRFQCNSNSSDGVLRSAQLYVLQNTLSSPGANTLLLDLNLGQNIYNLAGYLYANFPESELKEVVKLRLDCLTEKGKLFQTTFDFDYSIIPFV